MLSLQFERWCIKANYWQEVSTTYLQNVCACFKLCSQSIPTGKPLANLMTWQRPFKLNRCRIKITAIEMCPGHFVTQVNAEMNIWFSICTYLFQILFCWPLCKEGKWELIWNCLHGQVLSNSKVYFLLRSWKFAFAEFNTILLNFLKQWC